MGTRGAFGFIVNSKMKITFSDAASGPDDLGADILCWLQEVKIDVAQKQADDLQLVHPNTFPTAEQIEALKDYSDINTGDGSLASWKVLLYKTLSDIQEILDSGYMIDAELYPYYGGQCQWVYIVNFDSKVLEIYKSSNQERHNDGRFARRGVPWSDYAGNAYYPVKLVDAFFFHSLPQSLEHLSVS